MILYPITAQEVERMGNYWHTDKFKAQEIKDKLDDGTFSVPIFQRGIVWTDKQRADLMDTIKKGLPFGSILLYKTGDGKYQIIDGLQRSTAIHQFEENPAQFFSEEDIDHNTIKEIVDMIGAGGNKKLQAEEVEKELYQWVKDNHKSLSDVEHMQFSKFGQHLAKKYPTLQAKVIEIGDIIEPMMQSYQDICKQIRETEIPAIIMEGDQSLLPILFERINTKGLSLSKYQIYNATWPTKRYFIDDKFNALVKANRDRYDTMLDGSAVIEDYDPSAFSQAKELTLFEIAFGLGKYLCEKWPHLFGISNSTKDVESVGFSLLCTCLGLKNKDAQNLGVRFDELLGNSVNNFLEAITTCISHVNKQLGKYSKFKSNSRADAGKRPLHTEFQIVSIIASEFLLRYVDLTLDENDNVTNIVLHLSASNPNWKKSQKKKFENNIGKIYISEILSEKWKGSGDHKADAVLINPAMYTKDVSKQEFEATLDAWFEKHNSERSEIARVKTPQSPELLLLAAVYLSEFSAEQQVDGSTYDIEHLATKKLMKTHLVDRFDSELRLPISSFGNLCLLPEYENRSKKDATIYKDDGYLSKSAMSITDLEEKYTFTTKEQMDWLYDNNSTKDEFEKHYFSFINSRFEIMKEKMLDNYDNL